MRYYFNCSCGLNSIVTILEGISKCPKCNLEKKIPPIKTDACNDERILDEEI